MLEDVFDRLLSLGPTKVRSGTVARLPPSINQAYTIVTLKPASGNPLARPRTTLGPSAELKRYKQLATQELALQWRHEAPLSSDKGYLVHLRMCIPRLETKGYSKGTAARWVRRDASNWVKFAEDAVASAAGLDDSANLVLLVEKLQGKEGMYVDIYVLEEV